MDELLVLLCYFSAGCLFTLAFQQLDPATCQTKRDKYSWIGFVVYMIFSGLLIVIGLTI